MAKILEFKKKKQKKIKAKESDKEFKKDFNDLLSSFEQVIDDLEVLVEQVS